MSRAVFCPTRGDPFLISYWLRHFEHWRDHIDARLYLAVTGPQSDRVKEAIRTDPNLRPDDRVMLSTTWLDHGPAMQLLAFVTEDVVLLQEDDLYVRDPATAVEVIEAVEREYDVAAAPCHNCSPEIRAASLDYTGREPGLNPRFLAARTSVLHSVRAHFGCYVFPAGTTIPSLGGYVAREDCSSDAFCAAGLELRERASVLELVEDDRKWFHAGSLSTPGPMSDGPEFAFEGARAEGAVWCPRVSWWERFVRTWRDGLDAEHEAYSAVVEELVGIVGRAGVDAARARYDRMIVWPE